MFSSHPGQLQLIRNLHASSTRWACFEIWSISTPHSHLLKACSYLVSSLSFGNSCWARSWSWRTGMCFTGQLKLRCCHQFSKVSLIRLDAPQRCYLSSQRCYSRSRCTFRWISERSSLLTLIKPSLLSIVDLSKTVGVRFPCYVIHWFLWLCA